MTQITFCLNPTCTNIYFFNLERKCKKDTTPKKSDPSPPRTSGNFFIPTVPECKRHRHVCSLQFSTHQPDLHNQFGPLLLTIYFHLLSDKNCTQNWLTGLAHRKLTYRQPLDVASAFGKQRRGWKRTRCTQLRETVRVCSAKPHSF